MEPQHADLAILPGALAAQLATIEKHKIQLREYRINRFIAFLSLLVHLIKIAMNTFL